MAHVVLVVGGAGFVGSHVCKALHRAGYQPVVFDNLSNGHRWAVRWGPLELGDILDSETLGGVLKKYSPIAVMHFASCIAVGESVADPAKYYRNNVAGTLSLLEAMKAHGPRRLVFSSTAAVYGNPLRLPLDESQALAPVNPYGATKQMCERMIADFCSAHEFSAISLRYFNAAGADPDGEIGEGHEPETHLIPLVLEVAAGLRPAIDVFGDGYPTHDGTCVRDYVHVSDLADAHVLALGKLDSMTGAAAYNLGTGSGNTVMEVVRTVRRITGREVPVNVAPRRAGDPAVLLADGDLARTELGWQPRYTDLDAIVRHAWRWYRRSSHEVEITTAATSKQQRTA